MAKKRISVAVEKSHSDYIRSCLAMVPHEDFTISPIISGWSQRGYWSSEHAFQNVGERVMIRFTTGSDLVRPLLASGFGILASRVLQIQVTDALPV
jgi:hypothetical protein